MKGYSNRNRYSKNLEVIAFFHKAEGLIFKSFKRTTPHIIGVSVSKFQFDMF